MKLIMQYVALFLVFIQLSCTDAQDTEPIVDSQNKNIYRSNSDEDACGFKDGTYSASVDYENATTGYTANYILDVDVEDCQVIVINFSNGGFLDESHINAGDIDSDGDAEIEGENGKTFSIHLNEDDKTQGGE